MIPEPEIVQPGPPINLFVDDFRQAPEGWTLATTVAQAKYLLMTRKVRLLSLDHDMGACSLCIASSSHVGDMQTPETTFFNWCPHAEDGTALVRWIIETGYWPQEKPTVHSMNPVGAARMRGMIERYWENEMDETKGQIDVQDFAALCLQRSRRVYEAGDKEEAVRILRLLASELEKIIGLIENELSPDNGSLDPSQTEG